MISRSLIRSIYKLIAPHRRVRSRMIAKRIIGHLKTSNFEILKKHASKYTWSNDTKNEMDRPTMLWILLQACNPSTRVGLSELKTDLRNANSAKFKHDVKKLTDYMRSKSEKLKKKDRLMKITNLTYLTLFTLSLILILHLTYAKNARLGKLEELNLLIK